MKIIKIECCNDCPYVIYRSGFKESFCTYFKMFSVEKSIIDNSIHKDCPLEDEK
jgi:hypothetical protein